MFSWNVLWSTALSSTVTPAFLAYASAMATSRRRPARRPWPRSIPNFTGRVGTATAAVVTAAGREQRSRSSSSAPPSSGPRSTLRRDAAIRAPTGGIG